MNDLLVDTRRERVNNLIFQLISYLFFLKVKAANNFQSIYLKVFKANIFIKQAHISENVLARIIDNFSLSMLELLYDLKLVLDLF